MRHAIAFGDIPAAPAATKQVGREPLFGEVAFCVLSWRAHATLCHTLTSFAAAGILDLFAERLIFFNEIDETDRAIARSFGFAAMGSPTNIGIFGGVDGLAGAAKAPNILFVENDCPLATSRAGLIAMVRSALADMDAESVPVLLMRSRRNPGEPFWRRSRYESRFRIVQPLGGSRRNGLPPLWRRIYEDLRRPSARGCAIYAEENPAERHPRIVRRSANGNWITSSQHLSWSNCCFLARRDFLRNVVLRRVRTAPAAVTLNGHQDIEAALKAGGWWRRQRLPIGQSEPGPFTHIRLDR